MRSTLLRAVDAKLAYKIRQVPRNKMSGGTSKSLLKPPSWAANFPPSTARPSKLFQFPGITPETTAAVRRVIEENDRGYDMYEWNRRYAHNHFTHSVLARYALGASPALIQATWEHDRQLLPPLDPKDGGREKDVEGLPQFNKDNWADPKWMGKKGSYSHYLPFFHSEVARLGPKGALEEYIFSPAANVGPADKGPTMLQALVAGVLHPLIHVGFGLEFNDQVMVAEGLSQTCLHSMGISAALFPTGWPQTPLAKPKGETKPLIQLYLEFLNNPSLDPGPYDPDMMINDRLRAALTPEHVADIHDLVARWDLSDMSDAGWHDRFTELAWLTTLLTGGTSRPGYPMRIDFFLMHTLTSCLFIPSYMRILSEPHRRQLLQTYLLSICQVLITRGRPHIFPQEVMTYPTQPTGGFPLAQQGKLEAIGDPHQASQQNPWLEVISNAIAANESHVPKSIRSLVFFAEQFGDSPKGSVPGCTVNGKEIIPGLADIDGSLFIRVAGKVMEYTGWIKEGDHEADWDRSALGWDGAWEKERVTAQWN